KAGIALQSDATINYITGKGMSQPSYDDLKIDSPYNTYKYRGLPPGPISNSGLKSIEAVIYPTPNPYYYFLTTLDDGTVIYSKTYEEHLKNKAKYLN
ncbi:MAG: endolytic transglycosylase MltG, partial [Patescibacteria group bacterium]